ncbi:uncharacterized protein RJT20DRAFT_44361 [Scheffersomyces xylosifermentans]|uniref:uncharacterized protein n=1 Tax=Scheffersomyces xylosifermentans TaxID=1304137 RepID=UPI00315C9A2C
MTESEPHSSDSLKLSTIIENVPSDDKHSQNAGDDHDIEDSIEDVEEELDDDDEEIQEEEEEEEEEDDDESHEKTKEIEGAEAEEDEDLEHDDTEATEAAITDSSSKTLSSHTTSSKSSNSTSHPNSSNSTSSKDYPRIYERYYEKFKKVYAQSNKLFELEKSQRQTLAYYQRKNNALLKLLDEFETAHGNQNLPDSLEEIFAGRDRSRLEAIVEQAPRLAASLGPLFQLIGGDDEEEVPDNKVEVEKHHLINLYINESIPDLINDDSISIQKNPQDPESWTRRHYPNLTTSRFKPVDFPINGLISEYVGHDYQIGADDHPKVAAPVTTSNGTTTRGKKRKGSGEDGTSSRKKK